ncbi:pyridoxamine 5'-phosphate oxidase family protein [Nocardioides sp. JQ2195]|uniref:pyridoxamine 5'-phosphate oxidase family protein n=1 Tax=Nocardioides sp. JQ2195 TaxID=2592334 RepID=UPI00143EC899|nr:pyridoxamine 5'-phosphate oxidase family protein [Nocardioides sp. JQ2195]QIX28461.1 pyridoxamine 5'-phosphate oxidase family protein [Nocardioides sp. JQ2195]
MSIVIDLARLTAALADFGAGYLVTTAADGRAKVVTVDPRDGDGDSDAEGAIVLPPSKGSARNLVDNPAATLVFPPVEPRGYTLLIDGTAVGGDHAIRFTPESAVLHRPASHGDGPQPPPGAGEPTGCASDCRPA